MRYNELYEQADYSEGPDSTFTHEGKDYYLDPVLVACKSIPTTQFPVSKLEWVLGYDDPDPERVKKADLTAPIIVVPWQDQWVAVDGLHRLAKAVQDGVRTLPAKIINDTILKAAEVR